MELEFRRFQKKDFQAYALWFTDPEQDRWLGPLDREWLEAVLSEGEEGVTWTVFRDEVFVAVAETAFDPEGGRAAVTTLQPNPASQTGYRYDCFEELLDWHRREGVRKHIAFVHEDNRTARRCLERVGFELSSAQPNEYGYLEFRID